MGYVCCCLCRLQFTLMERHCVWDVVIREGIRSRRNASQSRVSEAFGVGVFWLPITRRSELCVNSESHRFLSHCVEIICGGVACSFLLNHNLAEAVPSLIHSAGFAEVRYYPSLVLSSLHHWPQKVVFIILRYCSAPSWGQWTNGLWSEESTPVFSPSLGHLLRPLWGRQQ